MAKNDIFDLTITPPIKTFVAKALTPLPVAVFNRLGRKSMAKGARTFQAEMKGKVAKDRGVLERSITIRIKTYRRSGVIYAVTGPDEKQRPHAHLIEFGHRMVVGGTVPRLGGRGGTRVAAFTNDTA